MILKAIFIASIIIIIIAMGVVMGGAIVNDLNGSGSAWDALLWRDKTLRGFSIIMNLSIVAVISLIAVLIIVKPVEVSVSEYEIENYSVSQKESNSLNIVYIDDNNELKITRVYPSVPCSRGESDKVSITTYKWLCSWDQYESVTGITLAE